MLIEWNQSMSVYPVARSFTSNLVQYLAVTQNAVGGKRKLDWHVVGKHNNHQDIIYFITDDLIAHLLYSRQTQWSPTVY